jgi:phosphatidylserine/phosphatidylglycerophosphate/cardiolipin synthase-like enzyme
VLPSIRTATKSLDIVSPYLSPVYARLLLDKARQGIIVRLVTSDSNGQGHREALRMLGQKSVYSLSPRAWRYVILALLFGLVGAFTASYVGLALFVIAVVAIVAILAKNVTRRQTNSIPLFVKVLSIHQLVHVKLYVVDQQIALVGSANLTYSGMNRNIELIEEKSMPSEVQAEIGVFTQLWGSHHVPFIPPLRSPSVPQPVQSGLNTDDALTREDAETLDRLYGKKKPP